MGYGILSRTRPASGKAADRMAVTYSVSLSQIIKEVGLETVFMPSNPEELLVTCSDVNRPGLALGGYYDYFDSDRIQVLGKSEHGFLEALAPPCGRSGSSSSSRAVPLPSW